MSVKRIETGTSRTAEMTCLARCLSYLEHHPLYHSGDSVAYEIMNDKMKALIQSPFFRPLIQRIIPTGMYEYVIARTKYIDDALEQSLSSGITQVILLGAGFDSRAVRFHDISPDTQYYEVDAAMTQRAKVARLQERCIPLPAQLHLVEMDFDRQSLDVRLLECGVRQDVPSLIILEGVTMYLQPDSIDRLFETLRSVLSRQSKMVFDFIDSSVLRHANARAGEKQLVKTVDRSGESFQFGIPAADAGQFLLDRGWELTDLADHFELQQRYFTDSDGKVAAHINETHCIASISLV